MRRIHLFELEDQPWCPVVLRDGATAFLEVMVRRTGSAQALKPALVSALEKTGQRHISDLCSGGGGPLPILLEDLPEVSATLSDLYPNQEAFAEHARRNDRISYRAGSVDCTNPPDDLQGLLTLFNAFHHFRPATARKLLERAVERRQPIALFELVDRSKLLSLPFFPLIIFLSMPSVRPLRLEWLFFTYVIPLIPLLILWDGLVSCLRAYSHDELRELTRDLNDFTWEIEYFDLAIGRGTSVVGIPRELSKPE